MVLKFSTKPRVLAAVYFYGRALYKNNLKYLPQSHPCFGTTEDFGPKSDRLRNAGQKDLLDLIAQLQSVSKISSPVKQKACPFFAFIPRRYLKSGNFIF
jgi:hypothetical protein